MWICLLRQQLWISETFPEGIHQNPTDLHEAETPFSSGLSLAFLSTSAPLCLMYSRTLILLFCLLQSVSNTQNWWAAVFPICVRGKTVPGISQRRHYHGNRCRWGWEKLQSNLQETKKREKDEEEEAAGNEEEEEEEAAANEEDEAAN